MQQAAASAEGGSFVAKGVCLDVAIDAGEAVCDYRAGSQSNMKQFATGRATMPPSLPTRWDGVEVDDVGGGAVMADTSTVFGDCGVKFDVTGECRSTDALQELDGTGGLGALSRCVVRGVAVGSTGGISPLCGDWQILVFCD